MKVFISVLTNKLITFACKLFKFNGTQYPGAFVQDHIDNHILDKIKYPNITIAVTGSAGKGSACILIKHILEDAGYSVALNETGSNGINGATSMILNNCTLTGRFKKDVLLLECDEQHLKLIWRKVKPKFLLITNITRDQPTRNYMPENIFNQISSVITKDMHLVINGDDPILTRLTLTHKGKISTFSIDKMSDDIKKPLLNNIDFAYCPVCNKKLKYSYYHYGHLGKFECPNKDFGNPKIDYLATKVDLEKQNIKINNNDVYINKNVIYAAYATLGAYAMCNTVGIDENTILSALNNDKVPNSLGKEFEYKDHKIVMLETKNENNLSYYQGCKYIREQKGLKSVIMGFEKVSKRYKDSDLSWLYDINFELLNDKNIDKIFVFGRFKYNIATRLEFAGIEKKKIVFIDDASQILDIAVQKTKGDIYTMIWYDMVDTVLSKVGA